MMGWIEHDHASGDALVATSWTPLVDACSSSANRSADSAWLALAGGTHAAADLCGAC